MKQGKMITGTGILTVLFLALSLCTAVAQPEEEEHALERPNPEENVISPDGGFGSKVREIDPAGPVTAPGGEKLREVDPSAPVVTPGSEAFGGPDPAGPVVSPGGSKGKQGVQRAFQPQPEPPGSPFRGTQVLRSGERVQFVATGMKSKAYIMKGGKRVPLADGAYSLGGGEGFSVKMGVVMEDKIPGGGPLSPGKGKMTGERGIIIFDSEPDVTKQSSPQAIIDDGKPGANSSLGGGGGDGVGPRGIVIQDRQLQQR